MRHSRQRKQQICPRRLHCIALNCVNNTPLQVLIRNRYPITLSWSHAPDYNMLFSLSKLQFFNSGLIHRFYYRFAERLILLGGIPCEGDEDHICGRNRLRA